MAWTVSHLDGTLTHELRCAHCGYGISTLLRPGRCPMCHAHAAWRRPHERKLLAEAL